METSVLSHIKDSSTKTLGSNTFINTPELSIIDRIYRIEQIVSDLLDHVQLLDKQMEHSITAVGTTFENLADKLENSLVETKKKEVGGYHDDDYYASSTGSTGSTATKSSTADSIARVQLQQLETKMEDLVKAARKSSKAMDTWMVPFAILLVILVGAAIGLYLFYKRLQKIHIL